MRDEDLELRERFVRLCEALNSPEADIEIVDRAAAFVLATSGDLRPEEADRLAKLFNWPPFTVDPTGPQYDPMSMGYWTPPMIVSWIALRSVDRQLVPQWRAEAQRWRRFPSGLDIDGYQPMTLARMKLETVSANLARAVGQDQSYDTSKVASLDSAATEMLIACRLGKLVVNIVDPTTGSRRTIPTVDWQDMEFQTIDERDVLRHPRGTWHSPTAAAEQVMSLWPASEVELRQQTPAEAVAPPTRKPGLNRAQAVRDFTDRVNQWGDKKGPGRDEDWSAPLEADSVTTSN